MGMPTVMISFEETATSAIKRGERGIVALILKDDMALDITNPFTVISVTDIPSKLKEENKEQIKLALMGYVNAPKKIVCYVIDETDIEEGYKAALECFMTTRIDYLAIPTVEEDGKKEDIASWIKTCRGDGKKIKAVLPHCKADYEGIINYTTNEVKTKDKTYTTEQYCSRIAGLIAGTPLTISCTYAPLSELEDCTRLSKSDADKAVDQGEFIVFWDGEKVKVGRGVNSFTTAVQGKGSDFKKIKIVEAMDMIFDDVKKTAEDNFLGKYPNSYDNKCILLAAIKAYFEQLERDGILSKELENTIKINIEKQRSYLKAKGVNTDEMSDNEIKIYDTDDKVFLKGKIKILDAIEEIDLPINI